MGNPRGEGPEIEGPPQELGERPTEEGDFVEPVPPSHAQCMLNRTNAQVGTHLLREVVGFLHTEEVEGLLSSHGHEDLDKDRGWG